MVLFKVLTCKEGVKATTGEEGGGPPLPLAQAGCRGAGESAKHAP